MFFHVSITDAQSTSIRRGDKFSAFTSLIYFNQIYCMKRSLSIAIVEIIKHNLEQRSLFIAIVEIIKHNLEQWSYFH